jgi:hypothetical protein
VLDQAELAGVFDLAHRADGVARVFPIRAGDVVFEPGDFIRFVRITVFIRGGQQRVYRRICGFELLQNAGEFRDRFDVGESGAFADAGIVGSNARTIPFFLFEIARRQEKNVGRHTAAFVFRVRRQFHQRGAFLVVARQVIEIFLLIEHVGGIGFFVARVSEQDNGRTELRGEALSSQRVDGGRFALASGRAQREQRDRDDREHGRETARHPDADSRLRPRLHDGSFFPATFASGSPERR